MQRDPAVLRAWALSLREGAHGFRNLRGWLPRDEARARAQQFDWAPVCDRFIGLLVAARHGSVMSVMKPTQKIHKLVA